MKKIIIATPVIYFLALFQTSFLPHFKIFRNGYFEMLLSPLMALTIFWSFRERPDDKGSFFIALFSGFFLDVFSEKIIGFWTILFLILVFSVKFFVMKRVAFPSLRR